MKLFGQIIRTVVNVAVLPAKVVADVVTLGGVATDRESYVIEQLRRIKEEAEESR